MGSTNGLCYTDRDRQGGIFFQENTSMNLTKYELHFQNSSFPWSA